MELPFAVSAVAIIIPGIPEVMDVNPHRAEELGQPLSLFVGHFDIVGVAVLFLEISPVFGELSLQEVVPTYCMLLFEKTLVTRRVWGRVNGGVQEKLKETLTENVQEDWIKEGVEREEKRLKEVTSPGMTSRGRTFEEMVVCLVKRVARGAPIIVFGVTAM